MKSRPVAAAIAISVGLIILLGTFLPIPLLAMVRLELIQWAVILAGVAALVGIGNLFSVHFQKIRRREKGSVYSVTLLVAMLATLLIGVLVGPSHAWMQAAVEIDHPACGSLADGPAGSHACLRQHPPPAPPRRFNVHRLFGDRGAHAPRLHLPAGRSARFPS